VSSVAARLSRARVVGDPPRPASWLAAALLLAGVLAGAALAFAPPADLARTAPTEDGFYALAVARHLGLGDGVTADGLSATNGFQPLWSLLCAPLYAAVGGDRVLGLRLTQLLGSLLWLAFGGLLAVYARDVARRHGLRGDVAAAVAAVVALGSVSVFRLFHNGLETGLLLVLVCAAVAVLDRGGRWTARRVLAIGVLLGAIAWARLDAVAFVAGVGAVAAAGAVARRSAPSAAPLAACALAAALLVPWLAYGVSLDGHLVPSGGRAQALAPPHIDLNAHAAVRAVGAWILAPAFRPSLHPGHLANTAVGALAVGVLACAVLAVRRRAGRLRPGPGTAALWVYVLFLVGYYTIAHGAFWFRDRYLAAVLVLAVPWLACAIEAYVPRRALPGLAIVVAALNLPLFGVLLAAPPTRPSWAATASNMGTHPNLNWDQAAWTLEHVRPGCRVGAIESGTLLYFRDNTLNLDGKVNPAVLRARVNGTLGRYLDRAGVDVLIDFPRALRVGMGPRPSAWRAPRRADEPFMAAVRRGRERCLR
jgi:hypothetical protein